MEAPAMLPLPSLLWAGGPAPGRLFPLGSPIQDSRAQSEASKRTL